jgi:hypothetical protein
MKNKIFLYHPKHGAKLFELEDGGEDKLYKDGWRDNPKCNDRAEPVEQLSPEPNEDDVEQPPVNISMEQLGELVEFGETETDDGFELNVINHLASVLGPVGESAGGEVKSLDPAAHPDDDEAPESTVSLADEVASLLERFKADPKELTKEEHVLLGKGLGIKVMISSWSEDTLIKKINEQLANGDNEATS